MIPPLGFFLKKINFFYIRYFDMLFRLVIFLSSSDQSISSKTPKISQISFFHYYFSFLNSNFDKYHIIDFDILIGSILIGYPIN